MRRFCSGASALGANRLKATVMFGTNSCANADGTTKSPRWWKAEQRRQEWLTDRTSRHRSNLSMLTKDDSHRRKLQIPNFKSQTNLKRPNPKSRSARRDRAFNAWKFFGAWILGFGISHRLFRERIDSLRQTKIKLGQPAFAMRRENQTHFVVTNLNVRMMFFFLGHFGHGIYEINRIGKIIKLKSALDVFLLQLPFRDLFHAIF